MLTACPYTFKSLMEKRGLLNEIPTDEQIVLVKDLLIVAFFFHLFFKLIYFIFSKTNGPHSSRHIPGSTVQFTPEFVKYFHEREKFLKQYQRDLPQLKQTQLDLTSQEVILIDEYEKVKNE